MQTYQVYSLDMWGHVPADCSDHDCPCMVNGEHDDDACECHENCNQQFRCGTIDVSSDEDSAILEALHLEGFLSEKGREVCEIYDYSDGPLDVLDDAGRRMFMLEPVESNEGEASK